MINLTNYSGSNNFNILTDDDINTIIYDRLRADPLFFQQMFNNYLTLYYGIDETQFKNAIKTLIPEEFI